MVGALRDFIIKFFANTYPNEDNNLKLFLYFIINKFNPDLLKEVPSFNEKVFLQDRLSEFNINSTLIDLNKLYLILLIQRIKLRITDYETIQKLYNLELSDEYHEKFIECLSRDFSLEYVFNTNIFKYIVGDNFSILSQIKKGLVDFSHNIKNEIVSDTFKYFSRHEVLHQQLFEIFSINSNAKIMLYGPSNSGKTTFSKLFTQDVIIFDIDETIEMNVIFILIRLF